MTETLTAFLGGVLLASLTALWLRIRRSNRQHGSDHQHVSYTLLEWRVMMLPRDDWETFPDADRVEYIINDCVAEFRDKLLLARDQQVIPVGYGPVSLS